MKQYKTHIPEIRLTFKKGTQTNVKIAKSEDAHRLLLELFDTDTIEYFETCLVLYLNRANKTLGWLKLSQGGMTGTVVDVRILFATALKSGASGIIISHNHPSGQLIPSEQDKRLTKQIIEAGKLFEIAILDHLIVTPNGYFSFADSGEL